MTERAGTFERERMLTVGEFLLNADRKAAPFVCMSSGLSHRGGRVQWIMSPAEAKALGERLIDAAEFASQPMPDTQWGKP